MMKLWLVLGLVFFVQALNSEVALAKDETKKATIKKKLKPKKAPPPESKEDGAEALAEKDVAKESLGPLTPQNKSLFGLGGALSLDTVKLKDTDAKVELGGFGLLARGAYRLFPAEHVMVIGGAGFHMWNVEGKNTEGASDLTFTVSSNNVLFDGAVHYVFGSAYLGLLVKYETMISGSVKVKYGDASISEDLQSFSVTSFGLGGGYAVDAQKVVGGYILSGNGSFKSKPKDGASSTPSKFSAQEIAVTFDYFF